MAKPGVSVGIGLVALAFAGCLFVLLLFLVMLPWLLPRAFTVLAATDGLKLTARQESVKFLLADLVGVDYGYGQRFSASPKWAAGDWARNSPNYTSPIAVGYFLVFRVNTPTGLKRYGLRVDNDRAAFERILSFASPSDASRWQTSVQTVGTSLNR